MPPSRPSLARDFLFIANFWVFIGCAVFLFQMLQLALDYPYHLAGTGFDNDRYPPIHTLGWYGVTALELLAKTLLLGFPHITGALFSLGALLTLADVRPVLVSRPSRLVHLAILLLCLAPPIMLTMRKGSLDGAPLVAWLTAGIPALASLLVPRLRQHTFQIIGFMSGVALFAMGIDGLPKFVVIGFVWAYTASFVWFDEASRWRLEPGGSSPAPAL